MTNEEMQKTMQFILERQAQFAANIQRLEESQAKSEGRISQLEGAIVGVVNLISKLTTVQEQTAVKVNELTTQMVALAEAQRHTDERLNALINAVERYLSDKRNGNPRG